MLRDPRTLIIRLDVPARWALCAALALPLVAEPASAADYTLERVVLVSRHGVRAPTDSAKLADYTTTHKWPKWPVFDACLTPRGKLLASYMGSFYRREFAARGLFPANKAPAANTVFVLADVDQRTKQTGMGLLDGFFARQPDNRNFCPDPKPKKQKGDAKADANPKQDDAKEKLDPLFHPVRAGVCDFVPALAEQAVLDRVGGDLKDAWKPYSDSVQMMQGVLDCCQPKPVCDGKTPCKLDNAPPGVKASETSVSLTGPIAIGSTVSEVFLLQYAQGMPQVGWGGASTTERINLMLKLHDLQFDLIQRTNYLAGRQGSALVHQVMETLRQTAEGKSEARRPVPAEAKLVIYVGHDTNLANIGGMLGVDWQFRSGLGDKTPPAGAMAFALYRASSGKRYVRIVYYSQTLDQMRNGTRLRLSDPSGKAVPEMVRITIPSGPSGLCAETRDGGCPWPEFYERVKNVLVEACIPKR